MSEIKLKPNYNFPNNTMPGVGITTINPQHRVLFFLMPKLSKRGDTARAAWKEYEDLVDCKSGSHFEWADYLATTDGATYGPLEINTYEPCTTYCDSEWSR